MATNERVEENSNGQHKKIDKNIHESIMHYYHDPQEIDERLEDLRKEWDVERTLELNAAILGLAGVILGISNNKKWLILPVAVTTFLLQHAIQGWCPPLPLFRKLGYRTRREIDKEKYALKAVRGDFKYLLDVPNVVWKAVNK